MHLVVNYGEFGCNDTEKGVLEMNSSAFEPMARRLIGVQAGKMVKADMQEICSFTLERCFLGTKEEGEQLCPFTLEPVCMKTRALSGGWD